MTILQSSVRTEDNGDTTVGHDIAQIDIDGVAETIGVFSKVGSGVTQPTITGARNTGEAYESFLSALASIGWVVDSSALQSAFEVVTPSTTPVFDFSTTLMLVIDLGDVGADVTASTAVAPPSINAELVIKVIQDTASGPHTIVWPASFRWSGGTAPTLSIGNNEEDIVRAVYDGTLYYATWEGDF